MLDPPSQNKVEWPWRYRSRSKVMTCNTPTHASDHLYQIWKESMQNCRRYRADTIFKVKAEWPWKYRSRSKVITCDTPSHDDLNMMLKYGKNPSRTVDFFSRSRPKISKFCQKFKFPDSETRGLSAYTARSSFRLFSIATNACMWMLANQGERRIKR